MCWRRKKNNTILIEVISPLTPREREVMEIIADGGTYSDCAKELHISYHTAKQHIINAYGKLGVKDKYGAIMKFHGLNSNGDYRGKKRRRPGGRH